MNDTLKELENQIKRSWPTWELSEASQQAILNNIKMHQNISRNKLRRGKTFVFGFSLVAAMMVAFVLISPILHKKYEDSVQQNPFVEKVPPGKGKQGPKSKLYFPQKFPDKNTVFIDVNRGWKIVHDEAGGMSKEAITVVKTTDGGKTWDNLTDINGQENNEFLSGYKMGITFINSQKGWISINLPPDDNSPFLLLTNDGGKSWAKQLLPIPQKFNEASRQITRPAFFSSTAGIIPIILAATQSESKLLYMEVTHDAGKTWTPVTENASNDISWDFSDPQNGWVIYQGTKWVTTDLGQTWQSQ